MYMLQVNLISGQNDFNLGLFVIAFSLFMVMNTRDKEITDQPRFNHFDLKSNSTCNIHAINNDIIFVLLLSLYRNTSINQSARIFSLSYFLK